MEPVTWTPKGRQWELDELRLDQGKYKIETGKIHGLVMERYQRIINKMVRQRMYEKRRNEWYRNRRPGKQIVASSRYGNFTNTLQEIVRDNNDENDKKKERLGLLKWYRKTSRGKRKGKLEEHHML